MTEGTAVSSPISSPVSSRAAQAIAVGVGLMLGAYLLITSTVTLHETIWKFDVKRFLELCLLTVIYAAVLLNPGLRAAFRGLVKRVPAWVLWSLGGIIALGVVSAVHNSVSTWSLVYSLTEVALLSLLGVAVFCVAACRNVAGTVFDQTAVVLLAMVGLTVGVQELMGVVAALSQGLEFHPRIALLHFSWPRFYNQVQAWSIPVIAALPLLFPGKPLAKLLCVSALALEWYVVIATGARGTALGVVLAVLIALVLFPPIRKTMVIYQAGGLLAGVLIYILVAMGHQAFSSGPAAMSARTEATGLSAPDAEGGNQTMEKTRNKDIAIQKIGESTGDFMEPITGYRMRTSSGRMAMWRGSLQEIRTYPFLGVGPMNYACKGPLFRPGHPHSFPLQFLNEWGIPAFLLLFAIAVFTAFALIKALKVPVYPESEPGPIAAFFATGLVSALVLSGLDGVFVMPASQVTSVLVGGALMGMTLKPHRAGPEDHRKRSMRLGPIATLMLSVCLSLAFLAFARHEIGISDEQLAHTRLLDRGMPRLWQNGKVCQLYSGISDDASR